MAGHGLGGYVAAGHQKTLANASVFSFEESAVFGALAFWIEVGEMTGRGSFWKKVVLLRLRGFLHALRLVEMTIPKKNIISSVVERSPSVRYEQWSLSRGFFATL